MNCIQKPLQGRSWLIQFVSTERQVVQNNQIEQKNRIVNSYSASLFMNMFLIFENVLLLTAGWLVCLFSLFKLNSTTLKIIKPALRKTKKQFGGLYSADVIARSAHSDP